MIGLALSGGGYRASLFHLGVLARLADEGLLRQVSVISTVSGGSIIGACYYRKLCGELDQERLLTDGDYRRMVVELIPEFMELVQDDVRDRVVISSVKSRVIPTPIVKGLLRTGIGSRLIPGLSTKLDGILKPKLEQVIGKLSLQSTLWSDLTAAPAHTGNKKPELVLNTSILENGQQLFFSTDPTSLLWQENERRHGLRAQDLAAMPVSRLVAASACVPGIFNPVELDFGVPGQKLHGVDGGVLDNLGGNAIRLLGLERKDGQDGKSGMTTLVSDASKPLSMEHYDAVNSVQSFLRIQDIFMDAIRELRLEGTDEKVIQIREGIPGIDQTVRELVLNMRTDLNAFTEVEAYSLMYAGYCACARETKKLPVNAATAAPASGWVFQKIRPYMETPTPEYLKLIGQKRKPKLPRPGLSPFQLLSLCYLLLYLALFFYVGNDSGYFRAFLYVGLIPVAAISLLGALFLHRSVSRGRTKGTLASLERT